MSTKWMLAIAAVLMLAATAVRGQNFWSSRFEYEPTDPNAFMPYEFSLDLLGTYATRDRKGRSEDAWGLGAGINYFITRNIGVGADTYADAFHAPYLLNASVIYRYPLPDIGLAPYGFAGFGRQWEYAPQWTGHLGAGAEFRFNRKTGVFLDVRGVFPDRTKEYALWRAGVRLGF